MVTIGRAIGKDIKIEPYQEVKVGDIPGASTTATEPASPTAAKHFQAAAAITSPPGSPIMSPLQSPEPVVGSPLQFPAAGATSTVTMSPFLSPPAPTRPLIDTSASSSTPAASTPSAQPEPASPVSTVVVDHSNEQQSLIDAATSSSSHDTPPATPKKVAMYDSQPVSSGAPVLDVTPQPSPSSASADEPLLSSSVNDSSSSSSADVVTTATPAPAPVAAIAVTGSSDDPSAVARAWTAHLDNTFGRHYFYNHITKVTTWETPPGFMYDDHSPSALVVRSFSHCMCFEYHSGDLPAVAVTVDPAAIPAAVLSVV